MNRDPQGDQWFEDYASACSEISHLYATALDRLTIEFDRAQLASEAVTPLAPVLLPQIVRAAEAHAERLATLRFQQQEQQRQQQEEAALVEAFQQQRHAQFQLPQDPW